ncbi:MAG TPA: DNA-binding protein [Candidatus Aenigmarchaeota archaeon]|nr:DNA-binding protein [Candidatus Aenigmarchaeota archaeon]
MKINELRIGMSGIELTAEVIEISEPRRVRTKFGYQTRVARAMIKDDSGEIPLTLWGNQIDEINVGDKIKITDGYVREFRGELQLNVPRKGKIERV